MKRSLIVCLVSICFCFGISNMAHVATADVDLLAKIHTVFQGNYTKAEIQKTLDAIVSAYGLTPGDKTYEQVASVALTLRKKTAVPEMETLTCVQNLTEGDGAIHAEFTDAAAMCVTLLSTNGPAKLAATAIKLQYKVLAMQDSQAAAPAEPN